MRRRRRRRSKKMGSQEVRTRGCGTMGGVLKKEKNEGRISSNRK